ncbi:hypothetical protein [Actinoallomurus rhizosphaericola]|uniref:hypothetical protein n=1 Tax=Actinoallomurus rhizosphaericola TaxID=2952536 RepID=UPI0020939AF9|nr:hypothetical protein [Actinoallomurus rhizosphaericola]MCO5999844.1 hypothetical protein [Actinoallomurus rhizosphaericola]
MRARQRLPALIAVCAIAAGVMATATAAEAAPTHAGKSSTGATAFGPGAYIWQGDFPSETDCENAGVEDVRYGAWDYVCVPITGSTEWALGVQW